MIRCHKCGYFNLHNTTTCIKCRTSLANQPDTPAQAAAAPVPPERKTVVMPGSTETPWDQEPARPLPKNSPAGGFKTVRRIVPEPDTSCLVAISLDGDTEYRRIDLRTDMVSLDRSLLDPANNSISRSGHAIMYQKDGSWYLENTTPLKTTFIRVNRPVKLAHGDVVLMGDSLFEFRVGATGKPADSMPQRARREEPLQDAPPADPARQNTPGPEQHGE